MVGYRVQLPECHRLHVLKVTDLRQTNRGQNQNKYTVKPVENARGVQHVDELA